jgi:hypothetical protein
MQASSAAWTSCIIDTAGRLHTSDGLMDELRKVAPRRHQAARPARRTRRCSCSMAPWGRTRCSRPSSSRQAVPLTGLVVTKLDGTARGGVVVAVHEAVNVPVKFHRRGRAGHGPAPFDATPSPRSCSRREPGAAGPRRTLDTPVEFLTGVGPRRAEALRRLNIFTARDLLCTSRTATRMPAPSRPSQQATRGRRRDRHRHGDLQGHPAHAQRPAHLPGRGARTPPG